MAKINFINIEEDQIFKLKFNPHFMVNKENLTALQVPEKIIKIVTKIESLNDHKNHAFIDSLAVAITYRRLLDKYNTVENWNTSPYIYAPTDINNAFDKFISTIGIPLTDKSVTYKELNELIVFFCKTPHGYDASSLIRPHTELYPVIT